MRVIHLFHRAMFSEHENDQLRLSERRLEKEVSEWKQRFDQQLALRADRKEKSGLAAPSEG